MRQTCGTPIRTRLGGDWQRCSRDPDHGPDGNGIDGHGLVDGDGKVYADAVEAPRYLGDGTRDERRRATLDETGDYPPLRDGTLVFREYRKTATIWAVQVLERFTVDTLEGIHEGKAGDYLAVGAAGELYPIATDILRSTYEEVRPAGRTARGEGR